MYLVAAVLVAGAGGLPALAVGVEETNTCQSTVDDPCLRTGTCSIQGAEWFQSVQIARSDTFDTQGWPGLCDMVHVGLVQGNCEPPGGQTDVTVFLSDLSFARIPSITGPLACAGEAVRAAGAVPDGLHIPGIPLTASLGPGDELTLFWGASCQASDTDYAIYEGFMGGGYTSHAPLICSTGGASTVTLRPGADNHYYLVVPHNGAREGAYGFDSQGVPRFPAAAACLIQDWICP